MDPSLTARRWSFVVVAASITCLANCSPPVQRRESCDRDCVARAMVGIRRSSTSSDDDCLGMVVEIHGRKAKALTAAHCLVGQSRSFVRPKYNWRGPALRALDTDQRQSRDPSSALDIATLELEAWPGMRAVPLWRREAQPSNTSPGQLSIALWHGGALELQTTVVTHENALEIRAWAPGRQVCNGSSGAPLLIQFQHSYALRAVVSHGSRDCSAFSSTIASTIPSKGTSPRRSCAECQAELARGDGPCVTAFRRCENDALCRPLTECIDGCMDTNCERGCRNNLAQAGQGLTDARGAVIRCSCQQPCSSLCSALCEDGVR